MNANAKQEEPPQPNLLLTIFLQLIGLVSFGTWLFTAMFAPMLFDGGNHWRVWALFLATLSGPVVVVLACIILWIAYFKHWNRVHMACALFLLASMFPMLGLF